MRRSLAAVPFLLAALAAGCAGTPSSGTDFEGAEQEVAEVVEQLQSAGERGNAEAICDEVLAKALTDDIAEAGSSCEQELDKAIKDADDFQLEVEDVTVTGTTATARVKGKDRGKDEVREFTFVREGTDWRATSLGS